MDEPFQVFRYDRENVSTWFVDDDVDDEFPASQIRGAAERAREDHRKQYPSNRFRTTSKVIKDNEWAYWFEWELTDAGQRARDCALNHQCCDDDGHLDKDATLRYWLERLAYMSVLTPRTKVTEERLSIETWIAEPWARPLRDIFTVLEHDHIAITLEGKPDYPRTIGTFLNLSPAKLLEFKDHFFSRKAEWSLPIQERIMEVFLSQPPKIKIYV